MNHWAPVRIGERLVGVAEVEFIAEPHNDWAFNATLKWYDHVFHVNFNEVNEVYWGNATDALNYFETREHASWG